MLLLICNEDGEEGGKHICELPPEEGSCFGYWVQFFYNSTSEACEEFIYTGCDGNKNRFSSVNDCEKKCSDKGELQISFKIWV